MSLIKRAVDLDRLFHDRGFVIDSPSVRAEKQPDGRVQLYASLKATKRGPLGGPLYYSPVTVNSGQVPSVQTDFPMLISLTDNRFKSVSNGGHVQSTSGFDIRPYADSALTTALTYELERYNASTGEVIMWVKRSSLSDGLVTYLRYGDAALTTDGSDGPNTFSNNFQDVFHYPNGTTLSYYNSAAGLNGAGQNTPTATTGKIDGGIALASSNSQSHTTGTSNITAAMSISAWVNATSFPGAYNAIGCYNVFGNIRYFLLMVKSNGKLACYVNNTAAVSYDGTGTNTLSAGTAYYLAMTYDSTAGLKGYVNGSQDGSAAANGALSTAATGKYVGQDLNNGRYWNGMIDEVHISGVARPANWITTEYNNQNSPTTFHTLGTEVGLG